MADRFLLVLKALGIVVAGVLALGFVGLLFVGFVKVLKRFAESGGIYIVAGVGVVLLVVGFITGSGPIMVLAGLLLGIVVLTIAMLVLF